MFESSFRMAATAFGEGPSRFSFEASLIHLLAPSKHLSNRSPWNSFFIAFYQLQNDPIRFPPGKAHLCDSMSYFSMNPRFHPTAPHGVTILSDGRRIEMPA